MKRLVLVGLLSVLIGATGCVGYRSASAPVYSGYYGNYSGYYDDCFYYAGCYGLYGYGLYGYGPYGYGFGYGFFGNGNGGVVGHPPLPGRGHRPPRATQNRQPGGFSHNPGDHGGSSAHSGSSHGSGGGHSGGGGGGSHSGSSGGHGGGGSGGHGGGGHR